MSIDKINGVNWSGISKVNDVDKADIRTVAGASSDEPLLLDASEYPNASVAFSFRKLRTAYTGNCIRVQNDSGTNLDIGFDSNGNLDTAAISTHCGSGDGKIVRWYDQSGSGLYAEQSSSSAMPTIFSGGSMSTTNSKPSASFDGGDRLLSSAADDLSSGQYYVTSVIRLGSSVPNSQVFSQDDSTTGGAARIAQYIRLVPGKGGTAGTSRIIVFTDGNPSFTVQDLGPAPHLNSQQQISTQATSTSLTAFVDSISNGSTSLGSSSIRHGSDEYAIGSNSKSVASEFFTGHIQEIIMWPTPQSSSRSSIESDIDTYYGIS